MLCSSSDSNYKALLIYIVCMLSVNIILGNLRLQQVKVELVLGVGVSVVTIRVHTR